MKECIPTEDCGNEEKGYRRGYLDKLSYETNNKDDYFLGGPTIRVTCLYAIVRFVPYAEISEFANVGIVLCVPDLHYFNFKLAPAKFKRINDFFEDLNRDLFGAAKENLENDLLRVKHLGHSTSPDQLAFMFKDIVRSRENIIRFGELCSALIDISPDEYLEAIYGKFIGRDFITPERHSIEDKMIKT